MLVLVSIGLVYGYGLKHIPKVAFYFFWLLVFYFLFQKYFKRKIKPLSIQKWFPFLTRIRAELFLFFSIIIFVFIHLIFLGYVPFISAWNSLDYYKIAYFRQHIKEHDNILIHYISAFMIKGIIPFAVLYFSFANKKFFYFLIPFAIFYSIALMQKSLIVSMIIPTIVYALINKKYTAAVFYMFIAVFGVYVLVYATNPRMRASQAEIDIVMASSPYKEFYAHNFQSSEQGFLEASDAIYSRVFLTTGLVAGHWFNKIPNEFPYAKGCGYHFLAPLLGCNFDEYDYSRIIYKAVYVKETKMGFTGTVTVANFVYDFANFGYYGLVLSAFLLASLLNVINRFFGANHTWNISVNALYIFWLSSGALSTLLFSGGWLITLFLYSVFAPYLKAPYK
jgi:hypothetical protein